MADLEETLTPEQQREREALADAFRAVLSTEHGARLVFWVLEQCAIYRDAFSGENNATNYNLGLQAAGRRVIGAMDAIDERLYPKLLIDIANIKLMEKAAADRSEMEQEDDDAYSG